MIATTLLAVALAVGQSSATAEPAGRLVGRVTVEGTNAPIASARVILLPGARPAGPFGPPQQTNDLGEFRLSGLPPGEYVIAAMPTGFTSAFGGPGVPLPAATARASRPQTTTTATYYPGTIDQAAAQPIAVAAGAEVGNIVF